jgi:hypothetical protein
MAASAAPRGAEHPPRASRGHGAKVEREHERTLGPWLGSAGLGYRPQTLGSARLTDPRPTSPAAQTPFSRGVCRSDNRWSQVNSYVTDIFCARKISITTLFLSAPLSL